jgi:SNF2 family DNA or RNA helicase
MWTGTKVTPIYNRADLDNLDFDNHDELFNIVISHDLCKLHRKVLDFPWYFVIVDEAHELKNPQSKRGSAMIGAFHRARGLLFMTATPFKNGPGDVFNMLHAIDPKSFPTRRHFSLNYCDGFQGEFGWTEPKHVSDRTLEFLSEVLDKYMVRNIEREPGEPIPGLVSKRVHLPSGQFENVRLNLYRRTIWIKLPHSVTLPERNEQAENDAVETNRLRFETDLAKLPFAMQDIISKILRIDTGDRSAIFYHHRAVGAEIKRLLERAGITYAFIDGRVSNHKTREKMLRDMRNRIPESPRVLVLSQRTCSQGIEIQPGFTHLFHVQISFCSADLFQADRRAYRLGADKDVHSYLYFAENSFDDILSGIHNRKQQVSDRLTRDSTEKRENITISC